MVNINKLKKIYILYTKSEPVLDFFLISEHPTKILLKELKEIGIGFAIEGHVTAVVVLYSVHDTIGNVD